LDRHLDQLGPGGNRRCCHEREKNVHHEKDIEHASTAGVEQNSPCSNGKGSIWPVVGYGLAALLGLAMAFGLLTELPLWPVALVAGAALLLGKLTS